MKKLELLKESHLIDTLKNTLNKGDKIAFLFGAGVSINTNKVTKKPNGIGLAKEFINIFEDLKEELEEDNRNELEKELKTTENKYLVYAKIFSKASKDLSSIFKNEICKIKGLESILGIKEEHEIYTKLTDTDFLKNVELNKGLEYFGKLCTLFKDQVHIFTSNIDPFLEIVTRKNGLVPRSKHYTYDQGFSPKLNKHDLTIEHYHGYWNDKSLHKDLEDNKSNSKIFIKQISELKHLFVIGFGGWEDAMTNAISEYLNIPQSHNCTIHWCDFNYDEDNHFHKKLSKNIESDSFKIYDKIDSNILFEKLYDRILKLSFQGYLKSYQSKLNIKNPLINFENIDYSHGTFKKRKTHKTKNNLTDFIYTNLLNKKTIGLSSKFGLGKTSLLNTIINHLKEKGKIPFLISLKNKSISNFHNSIFYSFLFDEIICEINNSLNLESRHLELFSQFILKNKDNLLTIFKQKIHSKEIFIIIDGIDESNYRQEEFENVIENIKHLNIPLLFSFRTEFHKFLDSLIDREDLSFISIELEDWQLDTSAKYINKLTDDDFIKNRLKEYENLIKRPIFINNLFYLIQKDLEIINLIDSLLFQRKKI